MKRSNTINYDLFVFNKYKYRDYMEELYLDEEVYDNMWISYSYNSNNNFKFEDKKNTPRRKKEKTEQQEVVNEIVNKLKNNLNIIKK